MFLILGALDQEITELLAKATLESSQHWGPFSIHTGTLEKQPVCIVKCGVGKVLSAMLAQHLIDRYSPKALIFTGLAGALNSKFEIGDIILGSDCVQHDLDASALGFKRGQIPYTDIYSLQCDKNLLNSALAFKSSNLIIHVGRILTGDQFISKSEYNDHKYLTSELQGEAVDMEGASVATVATLNKVPFLIVRTSSDKADGESPKNFNEFLPLASKHSAELVCHILRR
jgi:5'-methylthioadenosine/S-adenosylhomocysteine nucleosidase